MLDLQSIKNRALEAKAKLEAEDTWFTTMGYERIEVPPLGYVWFDPIAWNELSFSEKTDFVNLTRRHLLDQLAKFRGEIQFLEEELELVSKLEKYRKYQL